MLIHTTTNTSSSKITYPLSFGACHPHPITLLLTESRQSYLQDTNTGEMLWYIVCDVALGGGVTNESIWSISGVSFIAFR